MRYTQKWSGFTLSMVKVKKQDMQRILAATWIKLEKSVLKTSQQNGVA